MTSSSLLVFKAEKPFPWSDAYPNSMGIKRDWEIERSTLAYCSAVHRQLLVFLETRNPRRG